MSCQDCSKFCLCACGTVQTRTQIILYPIAQPQKNRNLRKKLSNKLKETQTGPSIDQAFRKTRLAETIESIVKMSSSNSRNLSLREKIFESNVLSDEAELETIRERKSNKENISQNSIDDDQKTRKPSLVNNSKIYPVFPCNKNFSSPLSTVRENDMTTRLLQKENSQLKQQLSRLQREEKQLLRFQQQSRERNNRELGQLKQKSSQLERKSLNRKQELQELKHLLSMAEKRKNGRKREGRGP